MHNPAVFTKFVYSITCTGGVGVQQVGGTYRVYIRILHEQRAFIILCIYVHYIHMCNILYHDTFRWPFIRDEVLQHNTILYYAIIDTYLVMVQ